MQDTLLERVLELWLATHILVDTELHWRTFVNPTLPPTSMHTLAPSSDEGRMPVDEVNNPESYGLLCSQLRSAAEKRAAQLSKTVMNDLERRLLQRQQSGWFETFLVALILLNCVERTCWLFRSWDNDNYAARVSTGRIEYFLHVTNHSCSGRWTSVPLTMQARAIVSLISFICF